MFQVSGILSSYSSCSLLTCSCAGPALGVLWCFVLIFGALLHAYERPGRLNSLKMAHPNPRPRVNYHPHDLLIILKRVIN